MDANNLINRWENCIKQYDLESIVETYSIDAVLWGTFSKKICDKSESIKEYFQILFEKKELKVHFNSKISRTFKDTTIISGAYEFTYNENGAVVLPARFTFVVCKDHAGNCKITAHHSSLMP